MENKDAIAWLKSYNDSLRKRIIQLNKRIEDCESEKKDIIYDLDANETLIKQLESQ